MSTNNPKRIYLWSGPRNISTALMYSFAQRKDTQVYDEPLYAYYLKNTDAKEYHPGAKEVLETMESDGEQVVKMMLGEHAKPVVFFKHMTHHLLDLDRSFMKDSLHIILTRNPKEMLPSYAKEIHHPTMDDVGYAAHLELLDYLRNMDLNPIVVDSKRILLNPKELLTQLCSLLNIPFDSNMLTWLPGERPEDGIWAQYWYSSVHKSTGFMKYQAKNESFPEHLKPLLDSCIPYYNKLMEQSIG